MSSHTERNTSALVVASAIWFAVLGLGTPRTAEAIVPAVQYDVGDLGPQLNLAETGDGAVPVWQMGPGRRRINLRSGRTILIQAAFPAWDPGLGKSVFVVKAVEDLTGTPDSWSVTASAYCTNTTVPTLVIAESPFDSNPIKSVKAECPNWMKVVGMGGEVSNSVPIRSLRRWSGTFRRRRWCFRDSRRTKTSPGSPPGPLRRPPCSVARSRPRGKSPRSPPARRQPTSTRWSSEASRNRAVASWPPRPRASWASPARQRTNG